MRLAVVAASVIVATAHADPLDDARAGLVPLRGIYRIVGLTENATTCDAEGPSVLADQVERMFVIGDGLIFCSTTSECRAAAAADHAPQQRARLEGIVQLYPYRFDEVHGRIVTGHVDEMRWLDARTCRAKLSTVSLAADAGIVTFERRSVHVDYSPDHGGCGADGARKIANHRPCDQRDVVRGVRVAMLPPR